MRLLNRSVLCVVFLLSGLFSGAQQLAFPGAEGYGRFATGGRGDGESGRVVEVTTLEDDVDNPPVGSFRWAFSQGIEVINHPLLGNINVKKPLTVVFKVGGVINLKGDIKVQRNNMTIAGQTAPGDGICFRGATVNFGGSKNLIVRYLRFRPGDELSEETSGLRLENGERYIIDHCSMSWGIEETTHFSSSDSLTVQWCIVSEALYNSIHKKGERGYAAQWGGEFASYHHNLLAHNNSRMPRINGSNENDVFALVDYRNNVNYNWKKSGAMYGGEFEATPACTGYSHVNMVNNYYVPGPASEGDYFAAPSTNRDGRTMCGYAKWYVNGNVMQGNTSKTNDNWSGIIFGKKDSIKSNVEHVKSDGVLEAYDNYTQSATDAYASVLEDVGATLPKRDAHDTRVIAEVKGEIPILRYTYTTPDGQATPAAGVTSGMIDTQNNLVSPEDRAAGKDAWSVYTNSAASESPADNDHDGIPNFWETAHGLNPDDISDGKMITINGYSFLENYLNNQDVYVSISELKQKNVFEIYPNPGQGRINIKSNIKIVTIEVCDFMGKQVKVIDNPLGIQSFLMPLVPSGMYLVKAIGLNQQHYVQTFVNK